MSYDTAAVSATTLPESVREVRVSDLPVHPTTTVTPGMSVEQAWGLMRHRGVRHAVVEYHGKFVGVVDETTIVDQREWDPAVLEQRVEDLVRRPSPTVRPSDTLATAATHLATGRHMVAVVNKSGVFLGSVTCGDIAAAIARWGCWCPADTSSASRDQGPVAPSPG